MRTVEGLEAARALLCTDRRLEFGTIPPHVAEGILRVFGEPLTPTQVAQTVIDRVREEGDAAVHDLAAKLDGAAPDELEVPRSTIAEAYGHVSDEVVSAMRVAAQRIRAFHEASKPKSWTDDVKGYGQQIIPVERVGAYVPGGTAPYPSTALMCAIPARVAGVNEIIMCTPASKDGRPHPGVLVAADIAGVDRVFRIGGAQAVAAMAYGTETVPRVDIVCGPGNVFVTLAKKLVYGDVGIDGLYGPTETVVLADESANPTLCAVDLLAQAEHDVLARPVLITTSEALAEAVSNEVEARLQRLDRGQVARAAVEGQGCIAVVRDLDEALELANGFAPEHLCLMVKDPWSLVGDVRSAGAVFVGEFSHEVLGDYVAGPSHVMPTGGTARFGSGIGVHSFVKIMPIVALSDETSREVSRAASVLARAEGLTAHAEAAEVRDELL